jgi:transketolase
MSNMNNENQNRTKDLQIHADNIRQKIVDIVYLAKSGHIGGSLSSVDIETVLYFHTMNIDPKNPKDNNRDRFILSKGHSVEALYCVLNAVGFIADEVLDTYGQFNSILAGHPTKKIAGVELNSGALGHGLSVGVGMAIGAKMSKANFKTYVLMGDGEQGEGSIYEAAMSASHYKLDNLVAIIDRNKLQISGKTEDVMNLEPMHERWAAFGWEVIEVDGNDIEALVDTFDSLNFSNEKPKLIIAHTIKGCGVSYMESNAKWHHGVPNQEQYSVAKEEINEKLNNLVDVE